MISSSYVGENKDFERQFLSGELEVELVPPGHARRAPPGRGAGIPAFFTPTGRGHRGAEGKETREFGRPLLLCPRDARCTADFAFVKAWKGDTHGNLVYR
jgi:3-oxoacid CoA-transferase subunit A